jgi:hypothetical protein
MPAEQRRSPPERCSDAVDQFTGFVRLVQEVADAAPRHHKEPPMTRIRSIAILLACILSSPGCESPPARELRTRTEPLDVVDLGLTELGGLKSATSTPRLGAFRSMVIFSDDLRTLPYGPQFKQENLKAAGGRDRLSVFGSS